MIELFFWTTPNGYKPLILLEETGLEYFITPVNISQGVHFEGAFTNLFPNQKIPAITDWRPAEGDKPINLFESGAILQYLAEKSGLFLPTDLAPRHEVLQWLTWQMAGLGPMLGQNFHFSLYAPEKIDYAISRFRTEVLRLYGVLENTLQENEFIAGDYSIADIASYPWVMQVDKAIPELLDGKAATRRWLKTISQRPAVKRAYEVGRNINTKPTINKDSRKHLIKA